jgi:hypothetical protein
MPMLTPDYSQEIKEAPAGRHNVRIRSSQVKNSKNSGDRMIEWVLEICDGEAQGAIVRHTTMLEGKGAGLLKKFLKTIDPLYQEGPFDPATYNGLRCVVETMMQEYNGKHYARVSDILPVAEAYDPFPTGQHSADRF